MRFDRPLGVGADGGHGGVRYRVTRHEPGRLLECPFDPAIGLTGVHVFEVQERGAQRCMLRHRLVGRSTGMMRLLWPLAVRQRHDAVLEHLRGNAERCVTGGVRTPVRYPWMVRRAAAWESVTVRAVPVPDGARLLRRWPGRRRPRRLPRPARPARDVDGPPGAGRIYLAPLRLVRPAVTRAVLRRAGRRATAPLVIRR